MKTTPCIILNVTLLILLAGVSQTATRTNAQTVYTPYAFTNFAGKPNLLGTNDGFGVAARFRYPEGVAVDGSGNLYVADRGNHTIRRITADGTVTTLAGTGLQSGTNDDIGSAARFSSPIGLAVDGAGNVYVADSGNQTIRKVSPTGVVTTLAGNAGHAGFANATGSAARFFRPFGVALDSATNVYIADCNNHRIRKITPAGAVTTLAGFGAPGTNDGPAATARFRNPQGVAVDGATNLFVTDSQNYTIRKITPAGLVTTLAGTGEKFGTNDGIGSAARFNWPNGVAVDSEGYIYVVDQFSPTIRRVTPAGLVTTLAGMANISGSTDGIGRTARFASPSGMALDFAGNMYVGDMANNRITKGTPALVFESSQTSPMVSDGLFQMRLTWPFATNVIVEVSPDLQNWSPVQTNALPPEGLDLSIPLDSNPNQFFRARLSP